MAVSLPETSLVILTDLQNLKSPVKMKTIMLYSILDEKETKPIKLPQSSTENTVHMSLTVEWSTQVTYLTILAPVN